MDTSDGYGGLEFVLFEPGEVMDTRQEDAAAEERRGLLPDPPALVAALAEFGKSADGQASAACMIRIQWPAGLSEATTTVVRNRVAERMRRAVRSPDFCVEMSPDEFALCFAGCDAAQARGRVVLLLRLVELEPALAGKSASAWAGIARPDRDDGRLSMRTVRLACELASLQDSGHIEVVDL
ncbi:MAG: hypothetical protein KF823_01975 [Xanthomonadales bacterium]|nr:hypothetical protein [Xanthomonadales bacterium]